LTPDKGTGLKPGKVMVGVGKREVTALRGNREEKFFGPRKEFEEPTEEKKSGVGRPGENQRR